MPLKPSPVRGCPTRLNLYDHNYQATGLQTYELPSNSETKKYKLAALSQYGFEGLEPSKIQIDLEFYRSAVVKIHAPAPSLGLMPFYWTLFKDRTELGAM